VPAQPASRKSSSWAIDYAFDQYLWQPDGNPNPISYSLLTGVGGKGVVPGRPDDTFGVAFARTQFSDALVPFLRQQLNLGLRHEDAVEMSYTIAVTPWLSVTADLQIVNPALKRALDDAGQLAHVDTAVVAGAPVRARF